MVVQKLALPFRVENGVESELQLSHFTGCWLSQLVVTDGGFFFFFEKEVVTDEGCTGNQCSELMAALELNLER